MKTNEIHEEYESISEKQFKEMEHYRNMGYSISQLAKMYNVSVDVVRLKFNEFKRGLL